MDMNDRISEFPDAWVPTEGSGSESEAVNDLGLMQPSLNTCRVLKHVIP